MDWEGNFWNSGFPAYMKPFSVVDGKMLYKLNIRKNFLKATVKPGNLLWCCKKK